MYAYCGGIEATDRNAAKVGGEANHAVKMADMTS
jgi:hypothetical protein